MSEFVSHYAGDFFFGENVQKTSGCGYGCVIGIAASGEGIGLICVNNINGWHGQISINGELLDNVIKLWG